MVKEKHEMKMAGIVVERAFGGEALSEAENECCYSPEAKNYCVHKMAGPLLHHDHRRVATPQLILDLPFSSP